MTRSRAISPIQITEDLRLIPLPQPMPGFGAFISAWLFTGDAVLLVDVGPSATAPLLIAALRTAGVGTIDAILLTHIHIDHSGGIGEVTKAFPSAPVVCHARAVPHLADPERLWEGSRKTLPDIADVYGPISPVPVERVMVADDIDAWGVVSVPTPGHASHHVSYWKNGLLFAGEAGGVYQALPGGAHYLRPATPPRYNLDVHLESIERLETLQSRRICYGHFGSAEGVKNRLADHRRQLLRWRDLLSDYIGAKTDEANLQKILDHILREDPCMDGWNMLPLDARRRETGFLFNSIRGMLGYLEIAAK